MKARRRNPRSWLLGVIIIVGAVIIFGVYQFLQNRPADSGSTDAAVATVGLKAIPPSTANPSVNPTPSGEKTTFRLVSEKAHLSAPIVEVYLDHTDNWDLSKLFNNAGHLQGTAPMGKGGNFVLAGHVEFRDGSSGPFAGIGSLLKGDVISIVGTDGTGPVLLNYAVTSVLKVKPDDFNMVRNHGYDELTLITCGDWNDSQGVYQSRVVVQARPIQNLLPTKTATSTPTPTAIPGKLVTPNRTPTIKPSPTSVPKK